MPYALLVVLGTLAAPFCFILSRPLFLVPLLDSETVAATWIRVGLAIFCVVPAVVVWNRPFWKNWIAVLRRARLRCFWEWRSATLRFPVKSIAPISTRQANPSKRRASSKRNRLTYSNETDTFGRRFCTAVIGDDLGWVHIRL